MIRRVIGCTRSLALCFKPVLTYPPINTFRIAAQFSTKPPPSSGPHYDKIKQQGRQFYENQVEKISELKNSKEFEQIISSIPEPIILDLYADWCEPCKKLTPRLETKVKSMENVKMIKVNIDKCPELAHALQVKSVPTVYLLFQGGAIDRIQGNVSDAELDKFFGNISKITGVNEQNKKAVAVLEEAKSYILDKKFQQAQLLLENFDVKKVSQEMVAVRELFLAQCYFSIKKVGKFKEAVARANTFQSFFSQVPDLNKIFNIMKSELQKIQNQSKEDPTLHKLHTRATQAQTKEERLAAKFELITHFRSKELNENALETAMEIIKEDKAWEDKKTNKVVLEIFKELGNASPLVQKYRKIMQRLLS